MEEEVECRGSGEDVLTISWGEAKKPVQPPLSSSQQCPLIDRLARDEQLDAPALLATDPASLCAPSLAGSSSSH
jgi:hypothetical protein